MSADQRRGECGKNCRQERIIYAITSRVPYIIVGAKRVECDHSPRPGPTDEDVMSQPEKIASHREEDTLSWSSGGLESLRDLTGQTLGDFEVERLLGRGGMGEVYVARQISLNRQVALKVLRPDMLAKENNLKRFEAEATAVAKLNHPNIVHIYTLGGIEDTRFIAMEFVQGTNLRDYIAKKGPLDLALAFSIMKQATVGVGAAGEIGLVHRDIKPENILLTKKGQVKIADFGLCRDTDANQVHLTQPGVAMGTPLYMSPEQAQGHPTDHRSDLYSLGVTFYHMLAGQPPFKGDSPLAIAVRHIKDTPVRLSVHRPEIPPELDRLVMKLLEKDPKDRYQSAAEMLRDLARVKEVLHAPSVVVAAPDVRGETVGLNGNPSSSGRTGSTTLTPTNSSVADTLSHLHIRGKAMWGLVTAGLIVGLLAGWFTRPEDLVSSSAKDSTGTLPALWMVPDWRASIPQMASAEEQYRYAQIAAARGDQEAAWVAVPGYFNNAAKWNVPAYTQLARWLLRHHDADRLKVFAGELARWHEHKTQEQELSDIIRAASEALKGDFDSVVECFYSKAQPDSITDPGLLELSLEVTNEALKNADREGGSPLQLEKLRSIQNKLVSDLLKAEHLTRVPKPAGRSTAS